MGTKIVVALLGVLVLSTCGGCGKSGAQGASDAQQAAQQTGAAVKPKDAEDSKDASEAKEGNDSHPHLLQLPAGQLARLGVATTAVQEAHYSSTSEGFGVVISHELVAQAAAELQTAAAASHLSDATLARVKRLAAGPGALGVDAVETAQRQQAADQAALLLARRKLTALLGVSFPWRGDAADGALARIADGSSQLLRVTFPPVTTAAAVPRAVRIASLDRPEAAAWTSHIVWAAPQDPTLPGRSVFAVLSNTGLAEGARVRAQAASDSAISGVVVPDAALVITNGEYWCYVRKEGGAFQRVAIDASRPLGEGYFVSDAIAPGDEVVTTGVGLLLARELNASTGTED